MSVVPRVHPHKPGIVVKPLQYLLVIQKFGVLHNAPLGILHPL